MKDLILIGDQASGKSLLANWIFNSAEHINVCDDLSKKMLLKAIELKPERQPYQRSITLVYITNEKITYKDVDAEKFLIIKLQKL